MLIGHDAITWGLICSERSVLEDSDAWSASLLHYTLDRFLAFLHLRFVNHAFIFCSKLLLAVAYVFIIVTHLTPAIQIELVGSMWLHFPRVWLTIEGPALDNLHALSNLLAHVM